MLQGDGLGPLPHPAALSAGSPRCSGFACLPAPPWLQSPPLAAVTAGSRVPTAGHIPSPRPRRPLRTSAGGRSAIAANQSKPPHSSAHLQTRPHRLPLQSTGCAPSIPSANNSHLGEGQKKLKLRVIFRAGLILKGLAAFTLWFGIGLGSQAELL